MLLTCAPKHRSELCKKKDGEQSLLSAIGKSQALEVQIGSLIIKIKNASYFASNNMCKKRKSRDL